MAEWMAQRMRMSGKSVRGMMSGLNVSHADAILTEGGG